jgi:hypothetical protein
MAFEESVVLAQREKSERLSSQGLGVGSMIPVLVSIELFRCV